MADPKAENDDIDQDLAEEKRRLDRLGKDAAGLDRETRPAPDKPDHAGDGGVI
jgi:hypothetical protein